MGWYTTGPGGLEYKYGNVFAVARSSRLGQLRIIPRVIAYTDDDVAGFDDLEFVGFLQKAVEETWWSWRHLNFVDADSIEVPLDADPGRELDNLMYDVKSDADSIARVYESLGVEPIVSLTASIEAIWTLPATEVPLLLAWLNEPLPAHTEPITAEALREGRIELDWYEPPPRLAAPFERFNTEDEARYLALHGLARATLDGWDKDLYLYQPYDRYQEQAWAAAEVPAGVLLFEPGIRPFMSVVAEAFEVPEALRTRAFFVARHDIEVELPAQPQPPSDDTAAGMAFIEYVARPLALLFGRTLGLAPGSDTFTVGWHPTDKETTLAATLRDAGIETHHLDDLIDSARTRVPDLPVPALIAAYRADHPDNRLAAYLCDGGGAPPVPTPAEVADLLFVLGDNQLPVKQHARLVTALRAARSLIQAP